jgi:large conductance mechanosensitive channel
MFKEFREFALKGNVLDMAVGIIIGLAFAAIINSLVSDVIMPPIGLLLGNVDFSNLFILLKDGQIAPPPYATLEDAKAAGAVTVNLGIFINTVIIFVIVALAVFFVVKNANRLKKEEEASSEMPIKECPFCLSVIPVKAVKCSNCTSDLKD